MNEGHQPGIVEDLLQKSASVDYSIRLPESEFEVMSAVWDGEPPMTTAYLMQQIGSKKGWKAPTLISFLTRLEERGFDKGLDERAKKPNQPKTSKPRK